ncbi:hypothetical protein JCM8208_004297 [Rhodotorula glutinis]
MFPHYGAGAGLPLFPYPVPQQPGFDPNQHPYPYPFPPFPHASPHTPSIDVVLQGATPSTAQSTPDDRPSASDSHPDSQHAEQSASPSSPQQGGGAAAAEAASTSSAAGPTKKPRPRPQQREPSWQPPPPPPPLDDPVALLARSHVGLTTLLNQGNLDARPSRQGPGTAPRSGACTGCRTAKAKCSQDEPQCTRCLALKAECVYPLFNKRGRKRTMTPNLMMLENCHRDVEAALALLTRSSSGANAHASSSSSALPALSGPPRLGPPAASTSSTSRLQQQQHGGVPSSASSSNGGQTDPTEDDDADARELKSVIESPLAVLAHISSLKVSESTEEESGKTFLPKGKQEQGAAAEGYFATGLYQLRSDADPAYDPVLLGILNAPEFERVVNYYFTHLRPFFFHLSPELHTPQFLRHTSPFLSSTLAYLCAAYIPELHDRVQPLHDHTLRLSDRVWSEGLKSLEIVQAYLLLIHWTPIENDWGDDRRWGWLGQALRIATEIKLHKTINTATYDFYRSVTPLGEGAYALLADARAWSWKLLFVAEIALCVSTGRLGSVHTLPLSTPGAPLPTNLQPSDPYYDVAALVALNRIYAKAITHSNALQDHEEGHESRLRPEFQKAWQRDIFAWRAAWPGIGPLIRLIAQHNTTILTSISLRFKGPIAPVLDECRLSARETAKMAVNWQGDGILWISNILIVNIAYAATLLLRLAAAKPGPIDHETKMLCAAVADVLLRVGAMRPTCRTLATLHGTRIRTLLLADLPKHSASAPSGALLTSPSSSSMGLPPVGSPYPPFSPTSASLLLPTQALLQAQEAAAAGHAPPVFPSTPSSAPGTDAAAAAVGGPNVFNLAPADSHALWNLFHEAPAVSLPLPASATMQSTFQPGTVDATTGTFRPDDWVYKSALDQDWLSSEPGAWAW